MTSGFESCSLSAPWQWQASLHGSCSVGVDGRCDESRRPVSIPGVYFFSSSTCDTCTAARQDLAIRVMPETFTEFAWEDHPVVFEQFGVDAVPATLVVATDGSAVLHTRVPKSLHIVGGP